MLEKVKLLPLIKELNKNENLIGLLIIPGQKKRNDDIIIYFSLNIVIQNIFIKSITVEFTSKRITIKKIFKLIG